MKSLIQVCVVCLGYFTCYAQESPTIQVSDSAKIFGKGTISTGDFVFNPSFTPDGKTVFFSKATTNFGYIVIFYSTKKGGTWSDPRAVNFTGVYRDADPFISADGKHLYFTSDRPVNGKPFKDFDFHCFYVELNGNIVSSKPVLLDLPQTANMKPAYFSFANNGSVYFFSIDNTGHGGIFMSEFKNGNYLPPVGLSFNDTKYFDFDPVVAGDESFIIFTSKDRKGFGGDDLWISFKRAGSWTEPVNMGSKINTKGNEAAPSLSRDKKTLYFSSFKEEMDRPQYKDGKITTRAIMNLLHSPKDGLLSIYEINISDLGSFKKAK
jgi:hypothetical protein